MISDPQGYLIDGARVQDQEAIDTIRIVSFKPELHSVDIIIIVKCAHGNSDLE